MSSGEANGDDSELEQRVYDVLVSELQENDRPDYLHSTLSLQEKRDIRFSQRVETSGVLQTAESYASECSPMDRYFEAATMVVLKTMLVESATVGALTRLTDMAAMHMDSLVGKMHRLAEMQRRKQPAKGDLQVLLKEGCFTLADVIQEYDRSRFNRQQYGVLVDRIGEKAKKVQKFVTNQGEREEEENVGDDPEDAFFREAPQIIPSEKPASYIPHWAPAFPPNYTYKITPKYPDRDTDPRAVREKLVLESKLGEKALHQLMSVSSSPETEVSDVSMHLSSDSSEGSVSSEEEKPQNGAIKEESVPRLPSVSAGSGPRMPDIGPTTASPVLADATPEIETEEKKKVDDRRFDVVAYANTRLDAIKRRNEYEEVRIESRMKSDEAVLGKYLGAYTHEKLPENYSDALTHFYQDKLKDVSSRLKSQRRRQFEAREEERRRQEREEEDKQRLEKQNTIEVGGLFGDMDDVADADDDVDEALDMEFSDDDALIGGGFEAIEEDHGVVSNGHTEGMT